jgi:hypothetical protein
MADFQWYAAVLLFQSQVGTDWEDDPLVDHQVTLIRAVDPEAAYRAALEIGADGEHSYLNEERDTVTWSFLGLADLEKLLEAPRHGAEVFSWRTRGRAEKHVRAKADLTIFADMRDAGKTAREILDE